MREAVESVPGVAAVDYHPSAPRAAPKLVGDLGLFVSRTLPLERVAAIKADVARAIRAECCRDVDVTVTANPLALDDETLLERMLLIAARRRLFVHHSTSRTSASASR